MPVLVACCVQLCDRNKGHGISCCDTAGLVRQGWMKQSLLFEQVFQVDPSLHRGLNKPIMGT